MVIVITKISDREVPEHWRILVIEGATEVFHDSATSYKRAQMQVGEWLQDQKA